MPHPPHRIHGSSRIQKVVPRWRALLALCVALQVIAFIAPSVSAARVEVLRWLPSEGEAGSVERYLLFHGGHSKRYTVALDVGIPRLDEDGYHRYELEVPDDSIVYVAIAARNWLNQQSELSNEIVRLPEHLSLTSTTFARLGDTPLIGDWDGDRASDIGVVEFDEAESAYIFTLRLSDGSTITHRIDVAASLFDRPIVGDWKGKGRDIPGLVSLSGEDFHWTLGGASDVTQGGEPGGSATSAIEMFYGRIGGLPLLARGPNNRDLPVIVTREDGSFVFSFAGIDGEEARHVVVASGVADRAQPRIGDWFGGGVESPGFVTAEGFDLVFAMLNPYDDSPASVARVVFGDARFDSPITGDWDGDGVTDIGVIRHIGDDLMFLFNSWPFRCPNGHVEPGEWCDDGNATDGDGCSSLCMLEELDPSEDRDEDGVPDFSDFCPAVPDPDQIDEDEDGIGDACDYQTCGNGILEIGEQCDDGNRTSGDGCSLYCGIEPCGNGVIDEHLGEECDDSNQEDGDGCTATCRIEHCGVGRPADGNDDGRVDGADYTLWAEYLATAAYGPENGDFNCDGFVDGLDYSIWADQFAIEIGCSIDIRGDSNDDGVVDGADYTNWADAFGAGGLLFMTGDFNCDGRVDSADYTIWADLFGTATW